MSAQPSASGNSDATVTHLPQAPKRTRKAITASAEVLTSRKIDRRAASRIVSSQAWQREAWEMFDITGELSYASEYEARSISQAVLFAAELPEDPTKSPTPLPPNHPASQAIAQYMGGSTGQSEALGATSTHFLIAGVSYHVAIEDPDHEDADHFGKRWYTLSNEEISFDGSRWKINVRGEPEFFTDDEIMVIRHWTPHPRRNHLPHSPVKPILPVLRELEGLTKHVGASIDSRLAGAGILFLPQEMTFPSNRDDIRDDEDPFVVELIENMTTPIADRDSAAAVTPMVVKVPGETLADITHLTFSTPLDTAAAELRREAIRRIALSLDIPPEILLGLGTASHWSAWQVEESSIKLHVEPKLRGITNGITKGFLKPILEDDPSIEDPSRIICWYDVTNLKLRPNRASDARDLHRDLLITDEARRRAAGFDEDDAPTGDDFRSQLLREVIVNSPQLGLNLLPLYGIEPVNIEEEASGNGNSSPGVSNRRRNENDEADSDPSTTEDDVGSSGPSDPTTPSDTSPG